MGYTIAYQWGERQHRIDKYRSSTMRLPEKRKDLQQQTLQTLIYCPATDEKVRTSDWEQFHFLTGQITWWYCPTCRDWHVMLPDFISRGNKQVI